MMSWLNRDRNEAGKKYEEIRSALIKRFRQLHSRSEPEELANKTVDRVAKALPKIVATYEGPPEPYFFSVAWFIYQEDLRKPVPMPLPDFDFPSPPQPNAEEAIKKELLYSCLEECMEKLSPTNRLLISDYYQGERQEKIRRRKEIAERLGITLALLRLKAQRVRTSLKKCILECMEGKKVEREAIM
jgi:DNA-directed RNA polymerase specialized sigma24 family protein